MRKLEDIDFNLLKAHVKLSFRISDGNTVYEPGINYVLKIIEEFDKFFEIRGSKNAKAARPNGRAVCIV